MFCERIGTLLQIIAALSCLEVLPELYMCFLLANDLAHQHNENEKWNLVKNSTTSI